MPQRWLKKQKHHTAKQPTHQGAVADKTEVSKV